MELGLVGTVKDTATALLPLLERKTDRSHLEDSRDHYRRTRAKLDELATPSKRGAPIHPQYLARLVDQHAAADAVFIPDVGSPVVWAARYLTMNGRRRLIGSFTHGSMANALPHAVGVQAAGAAAWPASLAAGRPVPLGGMRTMADGIAVGRPGDVTFPQVAGLIDELVTVGEDALSGALVHCLERAKLVVEPAGAAPVAALLEHPDRFAGPVVAVLSGGNVDPLVLLQVIRNGLVASSRYLTLRVQVPDRPGALAELLARVGTLGANVTDVAHSRISGALPVGEVDVELSLETRGPEHRDTIVAGLRAAGHVVTAPA